MRHCVNCVSYNVCKYADKRSPDLCQYYLLRSRALKGITQEMERQNEKWGEQNHPMQDDRLPYDSMRSTAKLYKKINDNAVHPSWFFILMEEVYESFAHTDPAKQREEMVQVAAVAVQIIEYLDRKMEE